MLGEILHGLPLLERKGIGEPISYWFFNRFFVEFWEYFFICLLLIVEVIVH